jgi:hypothetical protein
LEEAEGNKTSAWGISLRGGEVEKERVVVVVLSSQFPYIG